MVRLALVLLFPLYPRVGASVMGGLETEAQNALKNVT